MKNSTFIIQIKYKSFYQNGEGHFKKIISGLILLHIMVNHLSYNCVYSKRSTIPLLGRKIKSKQKQKHSYLLSRYSPANLQADGHRTSWKEKRTQLTEPETGKISLDQVNTPPPGSKFLSVSFVLVASMIKRISTWKGYNNFLLPSKEKYIGGERWQPRREGWQPKSEGVAFSCLLTGYPNNHIRNDDCPR